MEVSTLNPPPEISDQPPPSKALIHRVDHVRVFNMFCFFGGDVVRTAQAAACDQRIVEALAHDFDWLRKIKGRNRLDTEDGLKREQEGNRAANYHMAKQVMTMIDAIVLQATERPEEWAERHCVEVDKDGNKTFSTKPLVEIAKAVQIAQDMTYRALGDKIAAKAETTEASRGEATQLAINIYAGLEKLGQSAKRVDRVIDVTEEIRTATQSEEGVVSPRL
jgi:hypothetical protein